MLPGKETMKSLGTWLACGVAAISIARGAPPALILERGTIETASASQQAAFQLMKASARAPVSQRPTARGTAPWLVQFVGALRAEDLAALENAGATIRGYVPENALLVEAAPDRFAKIAALAAVAWAGEYLPAWKKSPALDGATEARECVATLFAAADKPRIGRALGELGVYVAREDMQAEHPCFHVVLSPAQMDEVAQWAEVVWIEPAAPLKSWGASTDESPAASIDVAEELAAALAAGERVCLLRRGAADAGAYGAAARAVDAFVQAHPDVLVVAAAGNAAVDLQPADGVADGGSVGSPATAKNALAVGAAEGRTDVARVWRDSWPEDFAVEPIALDRMAQADGPQGLAAFSGRGPCADGRIKPELVAPGTFVAVPRAADSAFAGWGAAENPNEIFVGGTGVAAEQVAAAAREARRWLREQRGLETPSAALVKALLLAGARDLAPGQYGAGAKQEIPFGRPNHAQGAGLLDLPAALQAGEGGALELHDAPGLATGAADVFELSVGQPGGRFVLALAYADDVAAPGAGKQLVNDLDLTVTTPAGATLFPNGRDAPDDLNNVEMIEFEADEAGVYLARVQARAVPLGGSQPYALVVRGPRTTAAAAATTEQP